MVKTELLFGLVFTQADNMLDEAGRGLQPRPERLKTSTINLLGLFLCTSMPLMITKSLLAVVDNLISIWIGELFKVIVSVFINNSFFQIPLTR